MRGRRQGGLCRQLVITHQAIHEVYPGVCVIHGILSPQMYTKLRKKTYFFSIIVTTIKVFPFGDL